MNLLDKAKTHKTKQALRAPRNTEHSDEDLAELAESWLRHEITNGQLCHALGMGPGRNNSAVFMVMMGLKRLRLKKIKI